MTKGIWGIILAVAFVFGSTGTIAFAAPPAHAGPPTGEPGNPLDQIIETLNGVIGALNELQAKATQNMMDIMNLDERVVALESAGGGTDDFALQADLDAEAATRMGADDALQTAIDNLEADLNSEAASRAAEDSALQSRLDSEAAARMEADDALKADIDAEVAAVAADLAAEVLARLDADATLQADLEAELTRALQEEAEARVAGDAALLADLNSEAAARAAADAELLADLNAEAAARTAADAVHTSLLDTITSQFCPDNEFPVRINLDGTFFCQPVTLAPRLEIVDAATVGGDLDVGGTLTASSIRGTNELCIGTDCRSVWPSASSRIVEYGSILSQGCFLGTDLEPECGACPDCVIGSRNGLMLIGRYQVPEVTGVITATLGPTVTPLSTGDQSIRLDLLLRAERLGPPSLVPDGRDVLLSTEVVQMNSFSRFPQPDGNTLVGLGHTDNELLFSGEPHILFARATPLSDTSALLMQAPGSIHFISTTNAVTLELRP